MGTSIFLSKVFGLYYVIIALAFILREQRLKKTILEMINLPTLMLFSGFITLIIGILLVVSHNIWVNDWRILITIISWLALIKGITIIFFPDVLGDVSIKWLQNKVAYYGTFLFVFFMGLILLYLSCHPS